MKIEIKYEEKNVHYCLMTIDNDAELKSDKQKWYKLYIIDLDKAYKYIEPLESEHEEDIDPLKKNKIF